MLTIFLDRISLTQFGQYCIIFKALSLCVSNVANIPPLGPISIMAQTPLIGINEPTVYFLHHCTFLTFTSRVLVYQASMSFVITFSIFEPEPRLA